MKLAIFLAILLSWGTTLAATSKGKASDLDCNIAKSLAINNALENFSMREFDVKKNQLCKEIKDDISCYYQREISSEVSGTFKKVIKQKTTRSDVICIVEIEILVEKTRTLKGEVSGKQSYLSGEMLELTIQTKEPLYAYVYNDHPSGLQKLFPHIDVHQMINGTFKLEDHKKVKYQLSVAAPYEQSEDTLIVIFSKHKITFKNRLTKKEFYDTIRAVPPYSRKVVYHNIFINRRPK